ncbi:DUF1521 domain-containing protein [Caballeronia sp. GAWG2-1]|uniref:DUF1521 domain-containing protein n=1 Tax=Caballeronia sp. GAWG2-1 TaxID=2921744 RepID=UPI0020288DBE|nr:DUF1521 domain-containing protein [Caballeronia sp. GAWG2-1]
MQANFDSRASFSMNLPRFPSSTTGFEQNSSFLSNRPLQMMSMPYGGMSLNQPFDQSFSQPFNQPAMPRAFGGSSMSSSNFSYSTQQMSRGPDGFSQSATSASYSSFERQGPGRDMQYNSMLPSGFSNQMRGDFRDSSQQMSRGPDGFSRSASSANYSYFERESPRQDMQYSSMQSSSYLNRMRGDACDGAAGQQSQWSDTGVHDGKSSIDLGDYKLDFDKSKSSINLTDEKTGNQTKVWGDPHIDLNSGTPNQTSGMFNGSIDFNLPDHTRVSIGTTPANGNSNVSFADNVTVTQGNRAYVVKGLSEQDSAPLSVQRSQDGFALAQQTPRDGMNLFASSSGTGWINAQTHQAVTASDFKA